MNPFHFPIVFQCPECGQIKTCPMYTTYVPDLICRNASCHEQGGYWQMVQLTNTDIQRRIEQYEAQALKERQERVESQRRAREYLDSWG